jgi:O-antigen polymerase
MKKASSSKNKFNNSMSNDGLAAAHESMMPRSLFYYLIFISLALPNLIYSGTSWFDTLHIMKWTFTMVPVAIISLWSGVMLAYRGPERYDFKLDLFGWIWLFMLAYISAQAFWADIRSWSSFFKEWFYFATLIGAYIFCYNEFRSTEDHKLILWCADINASINVLFAELLIRNENGIIPFIMNVPGNYIGNTGQEEMFGLWMAITLLNCIYLHITFEAGSRWYQKKFMYWLNLAVIVVNAWGLWNSTTRGAMLALVVGIVVLSCAFVRLRGSEKIKRIWQAAALLVLMLCVMLFAGKIMKTDNRFSQLAFKMQDTVQNAGNIGFRRDIWRCSWEVFAHDPIKGVGIGQFKWHFLDGQRWAMQKHPDMKWQFTYWAHSEYLQWFAEFGFFGGLLLLCVGLWWIFSFAKALIRKKSLSLEAIWGCGMLFLIWSDAIFSRPFHRIEDVIWLSFAFALTNRELLPVSYEWSEIKHSSVYRMLGGLICIISVAGLIFLGGGLRGDKYLHAAVRTNNASLQRYRIDQAHRMLMERDESEEQFAYHLIAVARATRKAEDWNAAINQLYRSFTIRPQGKQLIELYNIGRQMNNTALLNMIIPYFKPGTVSLLPLMGTTPVSK